MYHQELIRSAVHMYTPILLNYILIAVATSAVRLQNFKPGILHTIQLCRRTICVGGNFCMQNTMLARNKHRKM